MKRYVLSFLISSALALPVGGVAWANEGAVPIMTTVAAGAQVAKANQVAANGVPIVSAQVTAMPAATQVVQGDSVVKSVTTIPEVFGDGEKVAAVALEFPKAIDVKTLNVNDFTVEDNTIAKVYTNYHPATSWKTDGEIGRFVILELNQTNTVPFEQGQKESNRDTANTNEGQNESQKASPGAAGPVSEPGMMMHSDKALPDLNVAIEQTGSVTALDGTVYPANTTVLKQTAQLESVVEQFTLHSYTDAETGATIQYNVFLPKDYDATKSYPLYFFVADASANNNYPTTPLYQGNGATIFASEAEQAKHEAIIVAPQYTDELVNSIGMLTTDENKWTTGLTLVTNLLHKAIAEYPVDRDRIYGAGQSQGGMTNIAISDRYPDLFAAQWLVACQWNVEEMKALKDKKLWIVVSEGDNKAKPAMDEATKNWEALGTKVARSDMWDSHATGAQFADLVKAMEAQQAPINYTVFEGGNHMYTWSVAYNIEGIRDWLFAQTKSGRPVAETESGRYMATVTANKASRDTARAQMKAGIAALSGETGPVNYKEAWQSFKAAAKAKDMKANRYLGFMTEQGLYDYKDSKKAFHYYLKAAVAGDITSMAKVGSLYETGEGVAVDYKAAYAWYEKAAQQDTIIGAPGLTGLGSLYEHGRGVVKDENKARAYYEQAAALGDRLAILWLQRHSK